VYKQGRNEKTSVHLKGKKTWEDKVQLILDVFTWFKARYLCRLGWQVIYSFGTMSN